MVIHESPSVTLSNHLPIFVSFDTKRCVLARFFFASWCFSEHLNQSLPSPPTHLTNRQKKNSWSYQRIWEQWALKIIKNNWRDRMLQPVGDINITKMERHIHQKIIDGHWPYENNCICLLKKIIIQTQYKHYSHHNSCMELRLTISRRTASLS